MRFQGGTDRLARRRFHTIRVCDNALSKTDIEVRCSVNGVVGICACRTRGSTAQNSPGSSPPSTVRIACSVLGSICWLTNLTEPSAMRMLAPPGW